MDSTIENYSKSSDDKKLVCLKFYNWAIENNLKR